jgi:DNA-binding beta-propeller fold protein YncE
MLNSPRGVAFDGDRLVVCDTGADRVVGIDQKSGTQTLINDQLASPWGVAMLADGAIVATEAGRHRVWRIAPDTAEVASGDGQPAGIAARADGSVVYVEAEASSLRTTDGETLVGQGVWDWGASDGDAATAALQYPLGVAAADETVYVADTFNNLLRAWQGGALRTLPCAGLSAPGGIAVLGDGRLVVADTDNHRVVIVGPDDVSPVELVIDESWLGTTPGEPITVSAGMSFSVPYAIALAGADSEVRVELSSEPPSVLGPGPRMWMLDAPAGHVSLAAGVAGSGVLLVTVSVGPDTVRTRHHLTVTP